MNSSATGGVQYERVQGNEWDGGNRVHENVGSTKISEDEMRMKESANKNKKWREKGDRGGIKKEKGKTGICPGAKGKSLTAPTFT